MVNSLIIYLPGVTMMKILALLLFILFSLTYNQECDIVDDGSLNIVDIVELIWIIIEDPPPEANFVANPSSGLAPLEISFTNTSFLGAQEFYYYDWDFDDGSPNLGYEHPIHTFNYAGNYNACLTISTEMGDYSHCEIISVSGTSTVVDIDGNIYNTVLIGNQEWMLENLAVSHYNNGDPIQYILEDYLWEDAGPAYCYYLHSQGNADIYGYLYNWWVVDDVRGICPEGWRVPSDYEFTMMEWYLGMEPYGDRNIGGKFKEEGLEHWQPPNTEATNESGFTSLPAGLRRYGTGEFLELGQSSEFWSTTNIPTEQNRSYARRFTYNSNTNFRTTAIKNYGLSIRCLKD